MLRQADRIVGGLVNAGGLVSGLAILAIAATMSIEIVARYLLNSPTSWALEMVSYFLVASACFGTAYTLRVRGHIAVDVVLVRLPARLQLWGRRATMLVVVGIAAILIWHGAGQVRHAAFIGEVSLTPLGVRMWIPMSLLPLGAALLLLQALVMLADPAAPAGGETAAPPILD